MKTEVEARKCWCPYASIEGSNRVVVDLNVMNVANRCIASDCMAWRWSDLPNPHYSLGMHTTEPATIKSDERGHCGLAGRP